MTRFMFQHVIRTVQCSSRSRCYQRRQFSNHSNQQAIKSNQHTSSQHHHDVNHQNRSFDYDVCIVGGGLVGATLAALLRHSPVSRRLNVAVIEPMPTPSPAIEAHSPPLVRVVSLTPASHAMLDRVGALSSIDPVRIQAFDEMRVWQSGTDIGHIHWKAHEMTNNPDRVLGYTIENDLLVRSLHQLIETSNQRSTKASESKPWIDANKRREGTIHLIQGVKVSSVTLPTSFDQFPVIQLSDHRVIKCRLLIGSDGANSAVKKASNEFGSFGFDYHTRAVVATLSMQQFSADNKHATAWQKFLPTGPIALLPCHSMYASLVWSTTPNHAQQLLKCSPTEFIDQLNLAFSNHDSSDATSAVSRWLPGPISRALPLLFPRPNVRPPLAAALASDRLSFPLKLITPTKYTSIRCALMGDAAHVCHPLAGQGVNLGLADAETLARLIQDDLIEGGDGASTANVLDHYESSRRLTNNISLAGIDALHRIFTTNAGDAFSIIRGIGLEAFNAISVLKYAAANQAIHTIGKTK